MKHDNREKCRLRIITRLKIGVILNNAGSLINVKIYQKAYIIINRTWLCLLSPLITRKLYMLCIIALLFAAAVENTLDFFLFTNLFYK